jgi:hypothetical protein
MCKKELLFFALLLLVYSGGIGQNHTGQVTFKNLLGTWQANTPVVSSTLHSSFKFFPDGKFIYSTDGYDDLNPIKSIEGIFKINGNILYLKIQAVVKVTGCKIGASDPGVQFGPFQLSGGKLTKIKQEDTEFSDHVIEEPANVKEQQAVVMIDATQYYKLKNTED